MLISTLFLTDLLVTAIGFMLLVHPKNGVVPFQDLMTTLLMLLNFGLMSQYQNLIVQLMTLSTQQLKLLGNLYSDKQLELTSLKRNGNLGTLRTQKVTTIPFFLDSMNSEPPEAHLNSC